MYQEDLDWLEFLHLLSTLKDTVFNDLISLRTEKDNEIIKKFDENQRKIWSDWQGRKRVNTKKKVTYDEYVKAYGKAMKYI